MKQLLLLAFTHTLMASSLTSMAYVQVTSGITTVDSTQTGTESAHAHASVGEGLGLSFADMISTANYGGLFLSGTIYSSSEPSRIAGTVSFADTMTIFGGTGSGTLRWNVSTNCDNLIIVCMAGESGSIDLFNQRSATFTYGVPFSFGLSMMASDHREGAQLSQFLNVSNFRVDGAAPVTYITASDVAYGFSGGTFQHMPEPGTWLLGGVGLAAIIAVRRHRSARRS